MQRTLFLIPHEIFGLPVLGVGWVLIGIVLLAIASTVASLRADRKPRHLDEDPVSWTSLLTGLLPLAIAAVAVAKLSHLIELTNPAGEPVGIAVRGYGLFLMLAAVASVWLAAYRSQKAGFGSDVIFQIAPVTLIGGLIGARLFYVIQYHRDFIRPTWWETITSAAALTQGGLVVYGSFIGGFIAASWAVRRRKLPFWQMGDVIIPCLFIGLALGRLGCFMNGCCYGGACERQPMAVEFPAGSPVYVDQMLSGRLIGIEATPIQQTSVNERVGQVLLNVDEVRAKSLAESAGVRVGDAITLALQPGDPSSIAEDRPSEEVTPGLALLRNDRLVADWSVRELPSRAKPVWAIQLVSATFAGLLLLSLLGLEKLLRERPFYRPGMLLLIGFMSYAVLRFVVECLRVDEGGQFGTSLSISQWVSLVVFAVCSVGMAFRLRSPRQSAPMEMENASRLLQQ